MSDGLSSRFTSKVPTLWKLVEELLRGDHDQATTIEAEADAALQGGDGRGLLIWMHHRLDVHESWRVPTLILDGTAKPEIVQHWFPDLVTLPEIHIEAPHQRVTWIRASFAKSRLVPSEKAGERRNAARLNNVEDLRRYVEVQAASYRTGRPVDVLVVTYKGAEALLKAGPLPANVAVEHFNNLRAIIVVGRPLPEEAEIKRQAERMAGHPLADDDPIVQAVRWSICEAELLQVIARARGIRRTEANPLDVLLLGDVPLPLKIDAVASWEQAQPAPLELMAVRGVVPACDPDRPGYWPLVAAMLPDLFPTADAARKGLSRGQMSIRAGHIDECPRERLKAKPRGGRYSIPVLVDPERRSDLAALLDLAHGSPLVHFEADDGPEAPPPGVSLPVPEIPAPVVDLPAVVPAEPASEFLASIKDGEFSGAVKGDDLAAISDGIAPAADLWADYGSGIMPPGLARLSRDRRRAAGITQDDLARLVGISRPQLANAEAGRFGLSPDAVVRLRAVVASLPVTQPAFL